MGIVAAPHVEEVVGSTRLACSTSTSIPSIVILINALPINRTITSTNTLRAVISHLPTRTDHYRPADPRSAPAGRLVLAGLLFASHLSALSANRFSIGFALGAFERSLICALGTPVDATHGIVARDARLSF